MTRRRLQKLTGLCALVALALHGVAAFGLDRDAGLDFFKCSCLLSDQPDFAGLSPDPIAWLVIGDDPSPTGALLSPSCAPRAPPAA